MHPLSLLRRVRGPLLAVVLAFALLTPSLAQGPVSWWKGNGSAVDSADGNNGTLQGGVTYAPGVSGQSFSFNGTNGVVFIPDADNLKFTKSFTMTAYIYVKSFNASNRIFFRGDNRPNLDPYALGLNANGTAYIHIGDASGNVATASSSSAVPLNQWVFISGSLDDATGTLTLSLDGQAAEQITTTVRPFADLDPTQNPGVAIGNLQDPAQINEPFHGLIDEVKVYNVAKTITPPPIIISVDPATIAKDSPDIMLTLNGTGFFNNSVVKWNGMALATTYNSFDQLTAIVPASLLMAAGTATVTVTTPQVGVSNSATIKIVVTTLALTVGPVRRMENGDIAVPVMLTNTGYDTAPALKITTAKLGSTVTSTALPLSFGPVAAYNPVAALLVFPDTTGNAGEKVTLTVGGTFTGGTFSKAVTITLP